MQAAQGIAAGAGEVVLDKGFLHAERGILGGVAGLQEKPARVPEHVRHKA